MLTSIALVFLLGTALGAVFARVKLPSLLGMIVAGMILSPYGLDLLSDDLLSISAELRQVALLVILTRAGLSLNIGDLKQVGRPAILMCFVPASLEIIGALIFAPLLLGVTLLEAAVIGAVIAAVSPAVVVPRMIALIDRKRGTNKRIPQMIMASASVDDVYVIVLFTAFVALASGGAVSVQSFVQVPISIFVGVLVGVVTGLCLHWLFQRVSMRDTTKVLVVLSVSFLLLQLENSLADVLPMSGLLAVMSVGILLKRQNSALAGRLSRKYNKLWVGAEVVLFVLVGATVDLRYLASAGLVSVAFLLCAMVFRMAGVALCTLKTDFNGKERLFCMVAYTPKATVQAAIGSIPLAMGLACGQTVLVVAVLAILITAPFGAICIDRLQGRWLTQEADANIDS